MNKLPNGWSPRDIAAIEHGLRLNPHTICLFKRVVPPQFWDLINPALRQGCDDCDF